MLQRLPAVIAQVNAGNACENLLNKIRQILILFIERKKLQKKYVTIKLNSINLWNRMNNVFINF